MKKLLLVGFAAGALCCQQGTGNLDTKDSAKTLLVSGKLSHINDMGLVLRSPVDADSVFSVELIQKNDSFYGKIPLTKPATVVLEVNMQTLVINTVPGILQINGNADTLHAAKVTGTAVPKEMNEYVRLTRAAADSLRQQALIIDAFSTTTPADVMATNRKKYDELSTRLAQLNDGYVREHPGSFVSAKLLVDIHSYNTRFEPAAADYGRLNDSIKKTYYGKKLARLVEIARKTDIGQPAPDFSLPDPKGDQVKLSSYKGKYVLVDFWASWFGTSRAENINVLRAYQSFHEKGFEILGVSLDQDRSRWFEAVHADKLIWTQVCDLKGWDSEPARIYGVNGLPFNLLLDPSGKIIAKGLYGEALFQKLTELYR